MGFHGGRHTLKPQQLLLADMLNSGNQFNSVLLPRRSAKTASVLAWAIGRCAHREEYMVAYTMATTGAKARDRFAKEIVPALQRLYPDPKTAPFKVYKAAGAERILFDNGSIFQVLGPHGEHFRSDAFDVIVIDEAGEATVEMGEDIIDAALPTMDTRDGAMLVFAGTAGEYRKGNLLWDELEKGRAGEPGHGIIDFSAGDLVSAEELGDWETVAPLVKLWHPGVGTLTTLAKMQINYETLGPARFAKEYLGIFALVGMTGGLFDMTKWDKCGIDTALPALPEKFALAVAAHPLQLSASIAAVWRERGVACFAVLEHRVGVDWLPQVAAAISAKHKIPIIHDTRGVVAVEVETMHRMSPRPRLEPQAWKDVQIAAHTLAKEIELGRIKHWKQPMLDEAARLVTQRKVLGSWAFGRISETDDITPIEAVSLGLRVWDGGNLSRPKLTIIT